MPELPDVEIYRQEAEKALGSVIESVEITDSGFKGIEKSSLEESLPGEKLKKTLRRGKYLFLETGKKQAVAMHFGMTGYLSLVENDSDPPKYVKCIFNLDNDHRLCYSSRRKLGKVEVTSDTDEYITRHDLGQDALELSEKEFLDMLEKSRSMIKSFLTDQSIVAGVGNVYADEILFQARIHPRSPTTGLTGAPAKNIYKQMIRVLDIAIDKKADVSKMPGTFLLPVRKEGEKCPRCGGKIEKIRISGRTGYHCPACQKEN